MGQIYFGVDEAKWVKIQPALTHLFEFDPTHKILISGNHKPNISGTDDGIWRRIRLIPCEAQFLGDRADPGLEAKLLNELEHIAAWVLEGWNLYQISGSLSNLPKRIIDATAEYRDESDVLGEWLNERTVVNRTGITPSNEAYADYVEWCQHQHHYPVGRRNFIDMIKRLGISNRKIRGKWSLSGLVLRKNTGEGRVSF